MKFLAWHMGLGDAIAFAGLAIKIADNKNIIIPCYDKNLLSLRSIFINHPNIHFMAIKDDIELCKIIDSGIDIIKLGVYNPAIPPLFFEDHIEWMYRQAEEDINQRFDYCPIEKAVEKVIQIEGKGETFLHDDHTRGFVINRELVNKPFIKPKESNLSILRYAEVLKEAREIHCIDSSFLHLTECLSVSGRLVWHQYARPYHPLSNYKFRHNWEIIK